MYSDSDSEISKKTDFNRTLGTQKRFARLKMTQQNSAQRYQNQSFRPTPEYYSVRGSGGSLLSATARSLESPLLETDTSALGVSHSAAPRPSDDSLSSTLVTLVPLLPPESSSYEPEPEPDPASLALERARPAHTLRRTRAGGSTEPPARSSTRS
jgi:hypothetical protein